ncbi:MAG: Rieske 2Fe-2S domain-containing protein [Acidobacteriota bacterium]|nr:Rieske 2Fe-2S domain-containing protein [Acidobacteriota bacterium]
MKSRAVVMGHPLHPMLIPFPIAFLTGAVLFDASGSLRDLPSWWTTGGHLGLAGIASALVAAVPGLIDYLYTVPPDSSAKDRATKHLLVMLTVVALFGVASWLRGGPSLRPDVTVLGLEVIGLGLLGAGGYMGGTLVTRNLIGIDHRYAQAGKWREQTIEARADQAVTVAKRDELQVDQMKLLRVGNKRIVLARTEQGYVAFDDRCSHRGGSLAGGVMLCGTVQCLWHGSQFDVATGKVKAGPATKDIAVYRVTEEEGEVRMALR